MSCFFDSQCSYLLQEVGVEALLQRPVALLLVGGASDGGGVGRHEDGHVVAVVVEQVVTDAAPGRRCDAASAHRQHVRIQQTIELSVHAPRHTAHSQQVIAPAGAARRYAPADGSSNPRRIFVRPRTGLQSAYG